jgi:hypothetical protein
MWSILHGSCSFEEYSNIDPLLNGDVRLGFTFDSSINFMIEKEERMRYDRVMLKSTPVFSSTNNNNQMKLWVGKAMQMIGTSSVTPPGELDKGIRIWPSGARFLMFVLSKY